MRKNNAPEQIGLILSIIDSSAEEGITLKEIQRQLPIDIPIRTLQRRLATLVKAKELHMTRSQHSTRYQIVSTAVKDKVRIYFQQPFQQRTVKKYNREFLDAYHPNQTSYLSEIEKKQLRQAGTPPLQEQLAGTYAKKILSRLLIDLSWNSSRLEGNTYSLLDTERLLNSGEMADNKTSMETQMILNHKSAIEYLVEGVSDIGFNRYTILNLHALLSNNLLGNPEACGRLRSIPVAIGGSAFQPLDIPPLIAECFQQVLEKADQIDDPFEQAFFVMVQLPYLQPFEDVNKRVSRLAANIPFIKHNLSPLSFIDVEDHSYIEAILSVYELNRMELLRDLFISAYHNSARRYSTVRHTIGEPDPLRLRYHQQMIEVISEIILKCMNKKTASAFIQQWTTKIIPKPDQIKMVEIIETELLSLHIGNIARYHIRPVEFERWNLSWK